ncbi:MAG: hypothetical protein V3575_07070 [Candidatus Absconditabacteria bacterium]
MDKIGFTLNYIYENTFGLLFEFGSYLTDKVDILMTMLMSSHYFFLTVPLFIGALGFLETFGIIGLFIPIDLAVVTSFAFLVHNLGFFLILSVVLSLFIFAGLISGYFFGKIFLSKIIIKYGQKYPKLKQYLDQIDEYVTKYHFLAFPLLININYARPIMSMYFGCNSYDFKKYVAGSAVASIAYVVPRVGIGYLVGIFGSVIFKYLKIGYKYVFIVLIILLVIAFIWDIIDGLKKIKK